MKRVHFLEREPGEYGTILSSWLACEGAGNVDWRYSKRDGSPAKVESTTSRAGVTCKHCLKVLGRKLERSK